MSTAWERDEPIWTISIFIICLYAFIGWIQLNCFGYNPSKKIINNPSLIQEVLVSKPQDWDFDEKYFLEDNKNINDNNREIVRIQNKKNKKNYLLYTTMIDDDGNKYKNYTSVLEKKCFCRFTESIISSSLKEEDKKLSELIMKVKIIHQDSIKRIEDEKTKKLQQKNYEKLLVKKPIKLSE